GGFEITELQDIRIEHFTTHPGPIRSGGRTHVGTMQVVDTGPKPKMNVQPHFSIAETFDESVPVVAGDYVIEVLATILEYVINDVFVHRFGPYIGHPDTPAWRALLQGDHSEYPL
ncbi:MAG TPA: hypothetical protein VIJ83_04170, partial [Solirubrobacteraceae bacterium]